VDFLARHGRHSRGGEKLVASIRDLSVTNRCHRIDQQPILHVSRMGEEAATPGQPPRVHTHFGIVPRRFTLENHRLLLALPLVRQAQETLTVR
jgi:hypothetical protein